MKKSWRNGMPNKETIDHLKALQAVGIYQFVIAGRDLISVLGTIRLIRTTRPEGTTKTEPVNWNVAHKYIIDRTEWLKQKDVQRRRGKR